MAWPLISVIRFKDVKTNDEYILSLNYIELLSDQLDVEEKNDSFKLNAILTNIDTNTYEGRITSTQLNSMCDNCKLLPKDEYLVLTIEALTRQTNMQTSKFSYEINRSSVISEDQIELIWKYQPSENLKLILGAFTLTSAANSKSAILKLLTDLGTNVTECVYEKQKLASTIDELRREKNKLSDFIENCVVEKSQIEQELYAKFVCVLNEKKIRRVHTRNSSPSSADRAKCSSAKIDDVGPRSSGSKSTLGDLDLSNSTDDDDVILPEPGQLKRKINEKNKKIAPTSRKLRSPPPPQQFSSSDETDDPDGLLENM